MNPHLYYGCSVTASPTHTSPAGLFGPFFEVELRFGDLQRPVVFSRVHLSEHAERLITSGAVSGMSIEVVRDNGIAARVLHGAQYVVTGVELGDGTIVCVVPKALHRVRRFGIAGSVLGCCLGVGLAIPAWWAASTLLLVIASHTLRSFAAIPCTAFPSADVLP